MSSEFAFAWKPPKVFSGFFRHFSARLGGFISEYQPAESLKLPGTSPDGICKRRKELVEIETVDLAAPSKSCCLDSGLVAACFLFHSSVG